MLTHTETLRRIGRALRERHRQTQMSETGRIQEMTENRPGQA